MARFHRCGRSCAGLSQRPHSIGVSVSDTHSEIRIAATSVIENSRNSFSTMPPMKSSETKTATMARFIDSSVEPTSRAPMSAASSGGTPFSTCREMFSSTTMASSTTRPVATISAISDRLFSEKPHRYITAKLPIERDRHGGDRDDGGADVGQEQQHHDDDEGDGDQQRPLRLVQRGADGRRAVAGHVQLDAARQEGAQGGHLRR